MAESVIEVRGLGKKYTLGQQQAAYGTLRDSLASAFRGRGKGSRRGELWALRDVDLTVAEGEAVGIIGTNGAGKSTLLKILSRITEPSVGLVRTRGRVGVLLEVGTGFHPELTGRENVYLSGAVMGMTRRDVRRHYDEIVAFSGVERFLETPLKRYSSGMQLRLAFAVAAHLEPELMLVDEILAVGDIEFQRRCMERMRRLSTEGRTVIFVSHDLGAVARLCSRAVLMQQGRVAQDGEPGQVIHSYYSELLGGAGQAEFEVQDAVGLKHVAIVDDEGEVIPQPTRGDPLRVQARIVATEGVPHVDFSVYAHASDGSVVFHEAWADQPALPRLIDGPGEYVVTLRIPPILRAGDYALGLWLGSPHTCYFHREAFRFAVRPRIGDRETDHRPRAVQLESLWTRDVVVPDISRDQST